VVILFSAGWPELSKDDYRALALILPRVAFNVVSRFDRNGRCLLRGDACRWLTLGTLSLHGEADVLAMRRKLLAVIALRRQFH
jgi:hypothetical protein